ncbi:MAG: bifunctional serine/threonine-protein kinase/formylglycine-generating enzyme family protein [Anaerolineales bacterium]|nr:bifunctional serine/threonine-protein kinase/formylglycine-generating enzyme family protein [Anaerolineales bacterium]
MRKLLIEDLTGRKLGPYEILEPLGEGGMASVYKAFQAGVDRLVALKVLPRQLAADPTFVTRFRQEARALAQLQHPHIVPIHDFGEEGGYTYLAMSFIEGGTLVSLMNGRPLSLTVVRRIISQIGDALDYAHSVGIIHRDVKPSNILIDKRGNCLLTDFGVSKLIASNGSLTTTGATTGTPAYMSPEQGLGHKIDGRSDQYSLGVILYELVTGHPPYEADTPIAVVIKHIYDPLRPPRELNPELPENVERVILRALAKNPDERFATVGEMVQALQVAIPESGVFPPAKGGVRTIPLSAPKIRAQLRRNHSLALVAATGVVLLTLVGGIAALLNSNNLVTEADTATAQAPATAIVTSPPPIREPTATAPATTVATAAATIPSTTTTTVAATATPAGATPFTPTLEAGAVAISAVDGMRLRFVPAGPFLMGSDRNDVNALAFEWPQRTVTLDAFWIDETEVTNGQYALCVAAGRCVPPVSMRSATRPNYYSDPAYSNYPVIYVNWAEARDYCEWAGRRLPTEAEWEKAARGVNGALYPWGNSAPSPTRANFNRARSDTTAVGSYPDGASPFGALDMAGNVYEWVNDWYRGAYYLEAPDVNPLGPTTGTLRVLRGGAWNSESREVRAASRYNYGPTRRENFIGFRCAR